MGIKRINKALQNAKEEKRSAFVGYMTVGHPSLDASLSLLQAMQNNGADIIELGVPFSDPVADGPTIQMANNVALEQHVNLHHIFDLVKTARKNNIIHVPLILMGYFNPLLQYGVKKAISDAHHVGIDGIIVVDLPPEESLALVNACLSNDVSYIPLVTPTTTDSRLKILAGFATSFIYCVSVTGVTGARTEISQDLPSFLSRIRNCTDKSIAVGFGVSTRAHVLDISKIADAVVVGTALIKALDAAPLPISNKIDALGNLVKELTGNRVIKLAESSLNDVDIVDVDAHADDKKSVKKSKLSKNNDDNDDDVDGIDVIGEVGESSKKYRYGPFGGRYIPETLIAAHDELEKAFDEATADPLFNAEIARLRKEYIGGPTSLYFAKRLTEKCGGAKIWLKREELAHTGAHKINNAIGQALLAKRLNKTRVIAETGAGQHGVATATACAMLDLECVVYMGAEDCRRQSLNVFRMELLGATVVPVQSGSKTLKDAINEAMRDWVTNVKNTHYIIGSAVGAYPFPKIVQHFQSVIGKETRKQMMEQAGKLPDAVVACVGGGSNAIGMFHEFIPDVNVKMLGVEAGGVSGINGPHSATITAGKPGVLHGAMSYLLQDKDGQVVETHSISAGLDYPGVGPEHAYLKHIGRAEYVNVTDSQALEGMKTLARVEGIIPALETSHAVYAALQLAKKSPSTDDIVILLSGRGDKDMITVSNIKWDLLQ